MRTATKQATTLCCASCGVERGRGETCPTCQLMNDPIPLTAWQAKKTRSRWDEAQDQEDRLWREYYRTMEIGPEAYAAEMAAQLKELFE